MTESRSVRVENLTDTELQAIRDAEHPESKEQTLVEKLWQLHARGVSYASDKPAVNLLLADLSEGIRLAANALAEVISLHSRVRELEEALQFAVDHLAADTFHGDVPDEFYERARFTLKSKA